MFHEPVLTNEAVDYLITNENGIYLDGTIGGGGHAQTILERLGPQGLLIGLDLDEEAVDFATKRLKPFKNQVHIQQGNFKELDKILIGLKIDRVHGILLDLGLSSSLIEKAARGFSYNLKGPLDMRMNTKQKLTAYEIINTYSESELSNLFKTYGEERRFKTIARAIIKERKHSPIQTTEDLRAIVSKVLPYQNRVKSVARIFQALRIAVNEELENLAEGLKISLECLYPLSRMVVISYHSLEDRLVKDFFKQESARCVCAPEAPLCDCGKPGVLKVLTKRPVRPSESEIQRNPKCRSARLRSAESIGGE
ncbi:MAG: 16S rRNA (cytosine(1402)-N(4))-methyltransferase RsmH [bacterium]